MAGNSWQQPVAGEPSWGTPHLHYVQALSTNPADTNITELDLSAYVPVGTKGVIGWMQSDSTTANDNVYILNAAGTEFYGRVIHEVANIFNSAMFISPVDSARKIYWKASNARVISLTIHLVVYFI